MSEFNKKVVRYVAGASLSFGILWALEYLPWAFDVSDLGPYQLFFTLTGVGAVSLFVASAAGAFVARTNFTGPAVFFAIGVWYLTSSYLSALSHALELSDSVLSLLVRIGGLVLTVCGAVAGALIGRWLSTPREKNVSDAA